MTTDRCTHPWTERALRECEFEHDIAAERSTLFPVDPQLPEAYSWWSPSAARVLKVYVYLRRGGIRWVGRDAQQVLERLVFLLGAHQEREQR
jgi:hypothetical protein